MTTAVEEPSLAEVAVKPLATRGTSNSNRRGSAENRRRRKQWLLEVYAANRPLTRVVFKDGEVDVDDYVISIEELLTFESVVSAEHVPTARCYRCGDLLWFGTLTVDRIVPECKGGTYRRTNIRPACSDCNSETGGAMARGKAHAAAKERAAQKRAREKGIS